MPISTSTHSSDFIHEPLPHPITHIRLLEVLPLVSSSDVSIQCRLKCVRLADYDQCYTALSYTWGSSGAGHMIFVNGEEANVRSNLYEFLYLYRQKLMLHALPTVFLWIDALCLDHANVRERNSQAQIMPSIYQKAKTVLAWLEPFPGLQEVSGGRAGLRRFKAFLEEMKRDLDQPRSYFNDRYLSTKYFLGDKQSTLRYSAEWEVMLQLCRHHYWSRLWILQENRFAQNLLFMHADLLWSWDEFRAPFLLMWYMTRWQSYDFSRSIPCDPAQVLHTPAADVIRMRLVFEEPHGLSAKKDLLYTTVAAERWMLISAREPLSELLESHQRRLCSDGLDKVYALIGLSDSSLGIDYNRSNIELFCAVLLSLKSSPELSFISMLARQLGVSAFWYEQNRRSLLVGVPSTAPYQSVSEIIGRSCQQVYSVKTIAARTEVSDVIQSRLGVQKLNYYRIMGRQQMDRMNDWNDFPPASNDLPRTSGHRPGTDMPIVDGFDLSDTSFRAGLFLNPTSRHSRKAVFGIISTGFVENGDILVTDEKMYSGIIVRVSGLSKTWLTVVGLVLFARRVMVTSDLSSSPASGTPTSSIRSSTLSDFCQRAYPTPFTISGCTDRDSFILRPHDIQVQCLESGKSTPSSGRHSRSSSNATATTSTSVGSPVSPDKRRLTSKSDKLERILEVIASHKRRHSK